MSWSWKRRAFKLISNAKKKNKNETESGNYHRWAWPLSSAWCGRESHLFLLEIGQQRSIAQRVVCE
jgi:hypothetical protein